MRRFFRILSSQQRRPRSSASRHLCVMSCKKAALQNKPVQVGRFRMRHSISSQVATQIVDRNEQHVWPTLTSIHRKTGPQQCPEPSGYMNDGYPLPVEERWSEGPLCLHTFLRKERLLHLLPHSRQSLHIATANF